MNNQFECSDDATNHINIERIFPTGTDASKQILLHGKFSISYEKNALAARGAEVLKHIVLVVTRTTNYQAVTPFQDVIVFEDDVVATEDGCSGVFNIDTFKEILFDGAGDYYILCSIGSVISNILHSRL